MANWRYILYAEVVAHCCPEELVAPMLEELRARTPLTEMSPPYPPADAPCTRLALDMPGMVMTTRPWEDFDFDGLLLSIPCEDVAAFLDQLQELKERSWGYKLHGFHRCLCLSPAQRDALITLLRERVVSADMRARAFYADKKPMSLILREANAKAQGVPVEKIPDCGAHRTDHLHPRERGQA